MKPQRVARLIVWCLLFLLVVVSARAVKTAAPRRSGSLHEVLGGVHDQAQAVGLRWTKPAVAGAADMVTVSRPAAPSQ